MRYPLGAHRKELAAAEGAREREKELAKAVTLRLTVLDLVMHFRHT